MDASKLISGFNRWVVIGDVANKDKYASKILQKFKKSGYTAEGVHPKGGDNIYKTLGEVPYEIEAIDLCINSVQGIKYVMEAKKVGIKNILIQPGAESEEIISYCKTNGMTAIQGCALIELGRLIL